MPVTAADISTMKNIANGCPDSYGKAFYEARSILNLLYVQERQYSSHCADGSSYRLGETESIEQVTRNNAQITLYPNPNNGNMMLDYVIKEDANLEITDITGNLVGSYSLPAINSTMQIKNNNLQNGVYMYRVISNNTIIKTGKIVVMQ